MTSDSLTENEEHDIPSQILKTIFGLHASVMREVLPCHGKEQYTQYDPNFTNVFTFSIVISSSPRWFQVSHALWILWEIDVLRSVPRPELYPTKRSHLSIWHDIWTPVARDVCMSTLENLVLSMLNIGAWSSILFLYTSDNRQYDGNINQTSRVFIRMRTLCIQIFDVKMKLSKDVIYNT